MYNPDFLMIQAAQDNLINEVIQLIQEGVNVNAVNEFGETACIWAAFNGSNYLVCWLLQMGANIDAVDFTGRSALIWSAINCNFSTIQLLLDNQANPYLLDNEGKSMNDYLPVLTMNQLIPPMGPLVIGRTSSLPILRKKRKRSGYRTRSDVFDQLAKYRYQRISVSGTIRNFRHPGSVFEMPRYMIALSPVTIAGITVDHVNIRLVGKLKEIDDQLIPGRKLCFDGILGIYDQNKINVDEDPQNIIVQ